ncbi:peritrophin-55-like [Lucilia sericata]|uniref:peritrophin-55-like n=1 Tax=Lucilia sericata TaxID=13632 RepID=UPI0018A803DA|nr:peritrophin-55-like [Lucilia sericata]
MKIVAVITSLLVVAHHTLALVCPARDYSEKIKSLCDAEKDLKVLWPDYTNATRYYRCQGLKNPILENCFPNTIFTFYQQKCTKCAEYVPAPPCGDLKKGNCEKFTPAVVVPTPTTAPFCNVQIYTSTFTPKCVGNDIYRLWPNYNDVEKYYRCQAAYVPKIEKCPTGTYFNYYAQACTDCSAYVAAPACEKLISQADKLNKCVQIK